MREFDHLKSSFFSTLDPRKEEMYSLPINFVNKREFHIKYQQATLRSPKMILQLTIKELVEIYTQVCAYPGRNLHTSCQHFVNNKEFCTKIYQQVT